MTTLSPSTSANTTYRTVAVEGVNIFYREAGPKDAPVLLLLHGFPSSSRMFDTLIPLLADRYHLVAPDYPGFGLSDAPPPEDFAYTFDHLAQVVNGFVEALGLERYSLLLQDYGGPIGFRLALEHPERVQALIIQNAVAHAEGLGPLWEARKAYWRDRATYEAEVISAFTSLEGARQRHVGTSPQPERYNPDTWIDEFAALSRPGQAKIQADLFYDYHQCRLLPEVAGVATRAQAAGAGGLGPLRPLLHRRRGRRLWPRCSRGGDPPSRRRALRPRRKAG